MSMVRVDIKTTNPTNGSLGTTRWAAIREAKERKKQRATVALVMRQLRR